MKPGIPWSVKGIGNDAREAAKIAARRSGMTLGEWLNSVILESSDSPQSYDARPSARPAPPQRREERPIRLEDLAQQLARLTQREQDTAPRPVWNEPPPRPAIDDDSLARLSQRVETGERQAIEAFTAINERLAALGSRVSETGRARYPERPEDVPGYQALEGALRNVVEHIEGSERNTREAMRGLQDRLADMASRAAVSGAQRIADAVPEISRLESRLAEMAARLERTETSARKELPEQINAQIAALADQIDAVRDGALSAARDAGTVAAQGAQQELRDIEGRIQRLLNETQISLRSTSSSSQDVLRLKNDVTGLNQRIEELKSGAATERDVGALRIAVEQLTARVQQGPDMRPVAEMDRRLADLAARLEQNAVAGNNRFAPQLADLDRRVGDLSNRVEQTAAAGVNRLAPQLADLDQRLGELAQRLEYNTQAAMAGANKLSPQIAELDRRLYDVDQRLAEALSRDSGAGAARAFEQQLGHFADRLGQTEQQVVHLSRIESSIGQLYETIEQSRGFARDVAEDAANRMAERIAQSREHQAQFAAGPSPELRALEEGLEAVRASAASSDRRNQETLEAVHETLEQIVDKLAEMERERAAAPQAAWSHPAPAQPEAFAPAAPPEIQVQPQFQPPPAAFEAQPPFVPEPPPVEPQFAPAPQMPPAPSAGDPVNAGVREDFIAAARRAAQAAAAQQIASPSAKGRAAFIDRAKSAKGRGTKFSIPFFNRAKQAAPAPSAAALPRPATTTAPDGKRRTLLLAGFVILAAASLVFFKNLTGGMQDAPPPAVKQELAPSSSGDAAPAEGANGAAPPKPRPAELESGMPSPETFAKPPGKTGMSELVDNILTGALPAKADTTIGEIVTDPVKGGQGQIAAGELPPAGTGPEALRAAAAKGNAAAQFLVASAYLDGKGVEQDFTKAAAWYQKAAAKGLAPAQYRIATLFERGRGVPQDLAAAKLWYERAAERGNVKSMHNVAVIYSSAQDGAPDYAKAAKWFAAAAAYGLKDSQYNLAVLNERGLGVKQNMGESLFWYTLASRQNDADAGKKAMAMQQSLAPATVDLVKSRLAGFKAKTEDQAANAVAMDDPSLLAASALTLEDGIDMQLISAADGTEAPASDLQRTQALLISLGYDVGAADGKMGARTANAIRLFQLQAGMKVTGKTSPELIQKLADKNG